MAVSDKLLTDILDGLEGLPPSPWIVCTEDYDDGRETVDCVASLPEFGNGDPDELNMRDMRVATHIARLSPDTVREMVEELQAFRSAANHGTPPDFQEWGNVYPDLDATHLFVMGIVDTLKMRGASWFRTVRRIDDDKVERIYVDGWRERPKKEAHFKVLPPGGGARP